MYSLSSRAPRAVASGSNLTARVHKAINDRRAHAAGRHLLLVVQATTNTERL